MTDIEIRPIRSRGEWLDWRRFDATSTQTPILCGAHPKKTALWLWAIKHGLIAEADGSGDPVLDWGRWGQPAVIRMVSEKRPNWQIREANVYLRDPGLRMGATPDAAVIDPAREGVGTLECKMVHEDVYEQQWPGGQPPLMYQIQGLTAAMLMGASWVVIAALIQGRGWRPNIYVMERHADVEAKIRKAVVKFWADFDAGLMPIVNPALDAETIKEIYPKPLTKTPVDLSADNALPAVLSERAVLKAEVKPRLKRIEEIDTDIKAKLGIHESAILPGWKISWTGEHIEEHVVKAFDRRTLRVSKRTQ